MNERWQVMRQVERRDARGILSAMLAPMPKREDRPEVRARLVAIVDEIDKLDEQINELTDQQNRLRYELLPDAYRERVDTFFDEIERGDLDQLTDDAPITPCPAWCTAPAHATEHRGRNYEHQGAETHITDALGCYLWLGGDNNELRIYVSDGDHTLEQARQLAAGILRAVEVAEGAQR